GGSHTPAGWASGISIDQEIKNFLQKDPTTRTRFGSLEFGVMVPDRADTWTRMVYTGANKPLAPIDNPYQMFNKLYGRQKAQEQPAEYRADRQQLRERFRPRWHAAVHELGWRRAAQVAWRRRRPPRTVARTEHQGRRPSQADQDQQVVLRRAGPPLQTPG